MNKRKILESAQKHLQRGALDKALEDYQTLLKADPRDANIRLKVGDLHLKLGRTQDAIDAYLRVANQFTNDGFDAKAVALYKQISKLDEKRFDVHAQLGELYQRMGLTSEAMRAIQLAADGAHRAGDKSHALTLLRRMAALDPTNTANRLKVADLLRIEGMTDDALAEYDEVVRELARQNNGEEQIKVLERALELAPNRVDTLRALTRAAIEVGAAARAESAARALAAAAPDDLEALELFGTALERAGHMDEAGGVFRSLAEKFRARGDEDRARELVQRYGAGEAFGPGDSDPPVLEGEGSDLEIDPELDASLGLEDGSEIELEEDAGPEPTQQVARDDALELSAEEPEADAEASSPDIDPDADVEQLLAEASVFLRYGKHERAVDTLRAALRVEPGNPGALEKLGEALAAMGNRAHASSALARAGAAFADAGDAAGVERVRALLAPLDAKAAAALASPPRAAQAPPPRAAQAAAPADEESGDIDIEIDAGLDEDTLEPAPAEPQAEASPSDDFSGIEIDVSEELREAEREAPGDAEAPKPAADEELLTFETNEVSSPKIAPEAAAPVSADAPAGGADRAEADFEEAEFYREQGMLDEARALYERVIAVSPRHDGARKRLLVLSSPAEQGPAPRPEADATLRDARAFESPIAERAEPKRSAGKASAATPVAPAAAEPPLGEAASPGRRPPVAAQATPDEPALELAVETEEPAAGALSEPALGGADFDLAAELSGAFGEAAEGGRGGDAAAGDGFAEVFAAFKAGVKREVGEGDTEAHYDLGIAYKEMGLFEDAIGEFRFALADGARRLACLHLMAACALELGRSRDAVAHLSDALAGGALPPEQEAALRLDLGRAYQASGDAARARSEYEAVRAVAPRFADVDRLLADLAATEASDASEPSDSGEADEAFESFDDLIEPDAPAAPAQSAPGPRYESFSELIADDPEPELESAGDEAPPPPRPKATPPLPPPTAADASPKKPESKSKPAAEGAPPAPPARRKKKISFV